MRTCDSLQCLWGRLSLQGKLPSQFALNPLGHLVRASLYPRECGEGIVLFKALKQMRVFLSFLATDRVTWNVFVCELSECTTRRSVTNDVLLSCTLNLLSWWGSAAVACPALCLCPVCVLCLCFRVAGCCCLCVVFSCTAKRLSCPGLCL